MPAEADTQTEKPMRRTALRASVSAHRAENSGALLNRNYYYYYYYYYYSCTSPGEPPDDSSSSTLQSQPLAVPGSLRNLARPTQPLEPINFLKLRIRFADFPYLPLNCSKTRGCSPWRNPARESHRLPRIFKGRQKCTGHREKRGALQEQRPYLRPS